MQPNPDPLASPSLLTGTLFRVFNALGCGGVLLDERKRIIHASSRARNLFGNGIVVNAGCLCAADRGSDALLQTMLDQTLKYGGRTRLPLREALGLARIDKRPLIARIIPVEPEAKHHTNGAALVVVLLDPENCPEPSDGMLQQVFGLTKSEARVAHRLMCGESLQGIAKATGVSVDTIRTQTKSVFAKTGTNRQAELVGLLTRLAMISEEDTR
jgi:DNA-binding CsgD family transcriptional regulator